MKSSEPPKKDKAIGIRLPRETFEALQAKAAAHRRSLSNYVLLLIENDLAIGPGPSTGPTSGPTPGLNVTGSSEPFHPVWSVPQPPKETGAPVPGLFLGLSAPSFTGRELAEGLQRAALEKREIDWRSRLNEPGGRYGKNRPTPETPEVPEDEEV